MNDRQLQRYARHLLLDGFDEVAQQRLLDATVLVVGAGGLGSPALLYLAAAGVGHLMVADADSVDLTNLQRQVLHTESRIGEAKVTSAAEALSALNPEVRVTPLMQRADASTLPGWLEQADLVLDCSDNYATRHAVNAACVKAKRPLAWAAAVGWEAQASLYDPCQADSPCYACLFPPSAVVADAPCALLGVFAPLVGQAGVLQAGEALKHLAGLGSALARQLWLFDGRSLESQHLQVRRDAQCPVCGQLP
ncbi:ThiF family adenylyltransferase [Inhella sp.]|uniref:HesA/MoeB/ThiF family protein n=1 Tax=Inhella sp. TaxID=1921806 RepID=UPI0035B37EB7